MERPFRKAAVAARVCMAEGCAAAGEYRAPVSRDRLNEYYWFCLDHVRLYNATWDYCKGLDPDAIERELRMDATWRRPSWPLGLGDIHDPLGLLGGQGRRERRSQEGRMPAASPEARALAVLQLPVGVTFEEVRSRYKSLVKQLHPDATGGNRDAEDRLKVVNQAYGTLKAAYAQLSQATVAQPQGA
ncbi:MAG TPA: J domain-containing protein [Kiloniellales bacterium]|nr:J domain-containing protein [Kiloniellales bacterium]